MNLRTRLCLKISKKLLNKPNSAAATQSGYTDWRHKSLSESWQKFPDSLIAGKSVLDFGCGDGELSFYLRSKKPAKITGIDLNHDAIQRACARSSPRINFLQGSDNSIPVKDCQFDTVLAFDCMEHVMQPEQIVREWFRVLKPGGKCAIEWFPYKGPWGPHMESLIPIPWAHVIFGEQAMFRAAEAIYDHPDFTPRHWDLDEQGNKKPNKWRKWSCFEDQLYINKLSITEFKRIAKYAGFSITRLEVRGFGGNSLVKFVGTALKSLPIIGEYFVSHYIIELQRPHIDTGLTFKTNTWLLPEKKTQELESKQL